MSSISRPMAAVSGAKQRPGARAVDTFLPDLERGTPDDECRHADASAPSRAFDVFDTDAASDAAQRFIQTCSRRLSKTMQAVTQARSASPLHVGVDLERG